jgi:NAD(P)-dependent dehydrogenase (short-subunit alcohol dehydrogenase family)
VIADIAEESGRALAARLGKSAAFHRTDVASAASVETTVDFAIRTFGRLDVMFNNAGISEPMSQVSLIDEEFSLFDKLLRVDLLGPFLGVKYAARAMREQRCGSIINTASLGGVQAGFGLPVYRAAKAGVIALTRNSAIELGGLGIRVNCISPGPIETPMAGAGLPPAIAKQAMKLASDLMTEMQVLKRIGKPRDIAHAAVFLASDLSAQMTGQNLIIDGGAGLGDKINRVPGIQAAFAKLMEQAK